jgi:hypothetical protein
MMSSKGSKPAPLQSIIAGGAAGGIESILTVNSCAYVFPIILTIPVPNRVCKDPAAAAPWQF